MSLTGPLGTSLAPASACCFYCGEALGHPAIEWAGETTTISLHPGCVVELTIRLYRDLHELESRTGAYLAKGT